MLIRIVLCLFASALASACVTADDDNLAQAESKAGGGPRPPRPPEQAFAACASATEGSACSFDVDDHHVVGTCRSGPDGDGPLACAPPHPPVPPEAIEACTGADVGASCTFEIDGHDVDGTCREAPNGDGPLGCAPAGPPPQ